MRHVYFMAPLNPSPTQRNATALCKKAVRPDRIATAHEPAQCDECCKRLTAMINRSMKHRHTVAGSQIVQRLNVLLPTDRRIKL